MAEQLGPLQAGLLKRRERVKNQENYGRWDQTAGPVAGACKPPRPADTQNSGQPSIITGNEKIQHGIGACLAVVNHDPTRVSWNTICKEGMAEADRKRGMNMAINDEPELKQWLISDVIQRFFTLPASGRQPPSRSSALTPSRRISTRDNWPGAEIYEVSAAAAADARLGMIPKGYTTAVKGLRR